MIDGIPLVDAQLRPAHLATVKMSVAEWTGETPGPKDSAVESDSHGLEPDAVHHGKPLGAASAH